MANARYPRSFKLKVVSEVVSNEDKKGIQAKVAGKYGISNFSVSSWVKKYRDELNLSTEESKPVETSSNIVEQENEILKAIIIKKELEIKQLMNQYNLQTVKAN